MEEIDAGCVDAVLVDLDRVSVTCSWREKGRKTHKVRRDPAGEQRPLIRLWQPLHQHIQSNLIHQCLRDRPLEYALPAWHVVEQVRVFELSLEVVERRRELVGDGSTRLRSSETGMLLRDALELRRSVLRDLLLDVLDVALVELAGLAILEDHKVDVLLGVKRETGKDLKGGAGDTALVGARILEEDDLALLEEHARLLREEEVGAFDNVLEVRLAVGVNERGDVRDVDGLGATTAGDEDVGLEAEVGTIPEVGSVNDELASYDEMGVRMLRAVDC